MYQKNNIALKHFIKFIIVGATQYSLDIAIFAILVTTLPISISNILSRFLVTIVGFILNSNFTFSVKYSTKSLYRYIILWILFTIISTASIQVATIYLNQEYIVLYKMLIEITLAIFAFIFTKKWVFKPYEGIK